MLYFWRVDEDIAKQDEWHKLLAEMNAEKAKAAEEKEKFVEYNDNKRGVSGAKDGEGDGLKHTPNFGLDGQ